MRPPAVAPCSRGGKETAHVLHYNDLLRVAALIGISLREVPVNEGADLYVIVDGEGNDLYVGRAKRQGRHRAEDCIVRTDHTDHVAIGFVALWCENNASRRPLRHIPQEFDRSKVEAAIAGSGTGRPWDRRAWWLTDLVGLLDGGEAPTLAHIEEALIRIHVRSGRLIGNSQYASQWAGPVGRVADALAVLAVDAARVKGIIAAPPVLATDTEAERVGVEIADQIEPDDNGN